jgi:hypothetical protein
VTTHAIVVNITSSSIERSTSDAAGSISSVVVLL